MSSARSTQSLGTRERMIDSLAHAQTGTRVYIGIYSTCLYMRTGYQKYESGIPPTHSYTAHHCLSPAEHLPSLFQMSWTPAITSSDEPNTCYHCIEWTEHLLSLFQRKWTPVITGLRELNTCVTGCNEMDPCITGAGGLNTSYHCFLWTEHPLSLFHMKRTLDITSSC